MLYFGEYWSPVCTEHVDTPVGEECLHCDERIVEGDQGTITTYICEDPSNPGKLINDVRPIHRECSFRNVMGGIGHHLDHAFWCKEVKDPDGGMSRRESALKVWELFESFGTKKEHCD